MEKFGEIKKGYVPMPVPLKIRYKGVWDMQDLYDGIVNYLRERKWKFYEKTYKHKHPSPFGVERQYIWSASQHVDDFFDIVIDIYMHTYDAHDIETISPEGKKRIFTKGKIYIYLRSMMNWDYEKRWDTTPFLGALKNFYIKYVIKKRIMQGYSPRYRHEMVALHSFIQRRLKMETREFEYQHIAGVHRKGPG